MFNVAQALLQTTIFLSLIGVNIAKLLPGAISEIIGAFSASEFSLTLLSQSLRKDHHI